MMAITHAALSCTGVALVMSTSDPSLLVAAALASQLPDCDISTSYAGRLLFPIAWVLERYFPHRTITHSFLGTAIVALLAAPLLWWNLFYYQAIVLGFFFGWLGDVFTKSGVAAFYPSPARLIVPGNPKLRLSTGSPAEVFVLLILGFALFAILNINSAGGLLTSFSKSLGQTEGAADFYLKHRDQNLIVATLDGYHLATGKSISGQFEVVDLEGTELIVAAPKGLLKTGLQIKPTRITTDKGVPISVTTKELNLLEESPAEALRVLKKPPSRTYLSGELKLEDAEDLTLPKTKEYYPTMTAQVGVGVSEINLNNASLSEVIKTLKDYDATGTLFIKMVYVQQKQTSTNAATDTAPDTDSSSPKVTADDKQWN